MKKTVKIILVAIFCLGASASASSVFGIFSASELAATTQTEVVIVSPTASPEPEPTQTPEPTPDPEPLDIQKAEELPFEMLAPISTMSFAELVGDNGLYEDETEIPPLPSADTYKIVVNEYHQLATVYTKDENGEFTVPYRYMVVSTGAYSMPTIKGTFEMEDHYVRFGLFSCGVYGQYWRQITGAFYFHSLLYTYQNANSYTRTSYRNLGSRASHGCVRLFVPDARWIYYNIAPGTEVEIIVGDKDDEETAAIKAQFDFPDLPDSRPGLKAGEIPVTEAWPGWQGDAYDAYIASLTLSEEEDTSAEVEAG